jgi:hypothetical protein
MQKIYNDVLDHFGRGPNLIDEPPASTAKELISRLREEYEESC